ncbi:MAG: Outer membrane efflux protein BepC precursor [bacterium ADurb.Bin236]|nr:MAG: Outer membrane efflux protein BepC precursor [bacterium ADurb.Bin236]
MFARSVVAVAFMGLALVFGARAGGLTLEEAVLSAVANNPRTEAAEREADAARAMKGEVAANRLPRIDYEFSFIHLDDPPSLKVPDININLSDLGTALNGYFSGASQQLQALGMPGLPAFPTQLGKTLSLPAFELAAPDTRRHTLSFRLPLYTGGRVRHAMSQVKNGAAALDAAAESERRRLAFEVVQAYLSAVLAERAALVNDKALATIEEHVKHAEALHDRGMIPKYDLMRALTERANQERRSLDAKNQADLAMAFLLDLMGEPDADFEKLETPLGIGGEVAFEFDEAAAAALEASSDMKALRHKETMYAAGIKAARSELKPAAAFVASKELRDEDLSALTPEEFVGVVVRLPVFEGGAARAKASRQRALLRRNDSDIKRLENGVRLETRKYWLDLKSAEKALEASAMAVELAEESSRLASRKYEVGEGTSIEVTDAALALSVAEVNLDRAKYQRDAAYFGLKKAMGLILEEFSHRGGGIQ